MAKKSTYYRLDNLLKHQAQYSILLGSRSNGKSYAVKEYILQQALKGKGEFVYLRRYAMDVSPSKVVRYFSNMPISLISGGKYNEVYARSGSIWLRYYDYNTQEVNKDTPPLLVGHYLALVQDEHAKSDASFENVQNIVYEEFVTKGLYLGTGNEEPNRLLQLVSTICRRRDIQVFLIANTISRICPYFQSWELKGVSRQKQGTIEDYYKEVEQEDGTTENVKISVEFCESANYKSKMFFGASQKSITNGVWETDDEPRLQSRKREYKILYRIFVCDMGFNFAVELLQHRKENGRLCIFVYPCTPKKKNARIISTEYNESWNVTPFLNMKNKAELWIGKCYEFGKVAYSDNLTGADFKSILLNNDKLFKGASW